MHTTDFLAKAGSPGKKTPNKKKPAETKTTPKSVKLEPEPGPSSDPKPGKIIHLQNKINMEEFFSFSFKNVSCCTCIHVVLYGQ